MSTVHGLGSRCQPSRALLASTLQHRCPIGLPQRAPGLQGRLLLMTSCEHEGSAS